MASLVTPERERFVRGAEQVACTDLQLEPEALHRICSVYGLQALTSACRQAPKADFCLAHLGLWQLKQS